MGARRRGARAPDRPGARRERAHAHAGGHGDPDSRLAVERPRRARGQRRRGGIPPEHAERVFDRFYRVEGPQASGSGLGLAIARELAERMDGSVELVSVPGRTTFTLSLPLAPVTAVAELAVST